jgi:hypothetical protein
LHELVRGYRYQGDEGDEEEDEQGHRQKKSIFPYFLGGITSVVRIFLITEESQH